MTRSAATTMLVAARRVRRLGTAAFAVLACVAPARAQKADAPPTRSRPRSRATRSSCLLGATGRLTAAAGSTNASRRWPRSTAATWARSKACGARGSDGSGVGTKYSGEAQPLVYDGTIYVVTGADDVFALGVDSGEIRWSYKANLDESNDVVCCGWTSRGVALGAGKVYVGQLDGKLVALDQKTGKVEWSVQAERWQDGLVITAAPLYYDGLVIVGFAGAEFAIRGRVKAFDAKTGKLVWTFYTVPGPGERWGRHVAARQRRLEARRSFRLADAGRRPRARPHLLLDRQSGARLQRCRSERRQPVHRVDRCARREDRQIPLALPASASRHLGLRRPEPRRVCSISSTAACSARASPRRARRAGSISSTARTAGPSSGSTRNRYRRRRGRRPPRRSRTRVETRSCRTRSRSRPRA